MNNKSYRTSYEPDLTPFHPEYRLLIAVFIRALRDLETKKYRDSALEWLASEEEGLGKNFVSYQDVKEYINLPAFCTKMIEEGYTKKLSFKHRYRVSG